MPNKKTPMTKEAAERIQSHADRTGTNQDFKSRVQSTADRREYAQQQGSNETGQNGNGQGGAGQK